jgi:hypothetical protein
MLAAHNGHQEVVDTIVKKLCIDGFDPQKISYLPEARPKIFNDANKISNFANQICSFIATDLNLSEACHDKLKPLVRKSLFKEIFADENKENVNHITNRFAQKEVAKQVAEEVAEAIEEKLQSSRKVKPSKSVLSLVLSSELKTLDTEDEEVKELVGAPIKELVKKVALEPDTNPMHSQGMAAIGGRANNNRELS